MAAGSGFGNLFRISTWGESHGKGIGVVVDGCPAGLTLSQEDIQIYLNINHHSSLLLNNNYYNYQYHNSS